MTPDDLPSDASPRTLRPHPRLLTYYLLSALLAGPGFPVLAVYLYFRYSTLRYDLDAEGLTMRWGVLFRREVSITYARIQDIHLVSNLVERWLGIGRVLVQTASGSASAEVTVEGMVAFQPLRDFLYGRMRGARGGGGAKELPATGAGGDGAALAEVLREVAGEVRGLRQALEARR